MAYSVDIINLFINAFKKGIHLNIISKNLNISVQTLFRWSKIYDINNLTQIINKRIIIKSKEPKIIKYKKITVNEINENPRLTLKELKLKLNNCVSVSTLCRILKNEKISYKKINNRLVFKTEEKINEERKVWSKNVNIADYSSGIHIDESSFCVNDLKEYGYAKKGIRIEYLKHARSRERYSLLMAISKNKIEHFVIFNKPVTSDDYLEFIKMLNIRKRTLFQDNARIHHSIKVKTYCSSKNINLIYNPPYSPEFNPIENLFSKLKTLFRKMEHIDIIFEIKDLIKKITTSNLKNCYNHTEKIIKQFL